MAHDLYRRSLESLGVSQRNEYRLLASLRSVQQTHIQNPVLAAMDLNTLEPYIMDEWCYIAVMLVTLLNSFGLGLVMGFIWVAL